MPIGTGTLLHERYQVLRRVGGGGTASVWAALDRKTNVEVAIKSLHQELRLQPKNRMRFEREAQVLGSLAHPHIAKLLDQSPETLTGAGPRRLAAKRDGDDLGARRLDRLTQNVGRGVARRSEQQPRGKAGAV